MLDARIVRRFVGAMSFESDFNALVAAGRTADARALIETAAAGGDAEAQFGLATMRLYAIGCPRDLGAAHRWLGAAAGQGHREAILLLANLHANGTGVAENAGRAEALLAPLAGEARVAEQLAVARSAGPEAVAFSGLSQEPLIVKIDGLLTAGECAYLIALAGPLVQPSTIVDPTTGRPKPHPHRDSQGIALGPAEEDLVVRRINARVAAASQTDLACGEPLHILAYDPGQQYRPHLDGIHGAANQRAWTMLLWLNEDYEGGETAFPTLGISVRGKAGDALLFENVLADGRPDERTMHAGLPVTRGRKWLATRWIRQRPVGASETF